MLDTMNPVLKDRLLALGTFSGIAIAAIAGVEMVIGGGMDFLLPGQEIRAVAPSSYVRVVDTPWESRLESLTSHESMFAGDDAAIADERLAGGADDADAPQGGYPEVNDDELYANIDALYLNQDAVDLDPAADEDDEPYVLYVDEKKAEEAQAY